MPLPDMTGPAAPYWDALKEGRLTFQKCRKCNHAQLPPREACRVCLSPDLEWHPASGEGELISWIVYHQSFHPAFADRIPYNVAVVELAEGPRMTTNIHVADPQTLRIGQRVRFQPEERFGITIATFAVDDGDTP